MTVESSANVIAIQASVHLPFYHKLLVQNLTEQKTKKAPKVEVGTVTGDDSMDEWLQCLEFIYLPPHNVLGVNSLDFSSCNIESAVSKHGDGQTIIELGESGWKYYIYGIGEQCDVGLSEYRVSIFIKMSRPQEPHRPFFSFGNPFRMISPKGSRLTEGLLTLLNAFEVTLTERLKKLMPKDKDDVLSLSWMKLAMESLCETHNDIKNLITELELPVCDWEEKWIDVYLDISVKLLDLCIAFSSELTKLNQGHLLLQCVLHNLDSTAPNQFVRARSSLDGWKQHISSRNPRVESCRPILENLVRSLNLPKVKNSAKGKVLMRAMYGVKVQTVFVCSIFAAAFSGSATNLLDDLNVSDALPWALSFSALQSNVNEEIRNLYSVGKVTVLKELEAVDESVKILYPMIQDGVEPAEAELFRNSVSDLGRRAEKLSQGLDVLTKAVDSFFKIVLTGRDALLCNLRVSGPVSDTMVVTNVEQEVGK
ncbi:hypothetical protein LWI28_013557 [Acer negundo]|uniref:Phytocyanin domain-containing protein n=1 Tax=Acer negundo TaxID=4023 RepID=A0AAD5J476_ACENE|nr:hypothetical protein LWI28_013557 [Acer negundo]